MAEDYTHLRHGKLDWAIQEPIHEGWGHDLITFEDWRYPNGKVDHGSLYYSTPSRVEKAFWDEIKRQERLLKKRDATIRKLRKQLRQENAHS